VPLPELQSDPPNTVTPRTSAVTVIAGHVSVELSVATTTDNPALLLTGPLFGFDGSLPPYAERQFPELSIRVDDASILTSDRFEAFFGRRNITNFLRQADLDPWIITRNPPVIAADTEHQQSLKALANMGAIEPVGEDFRAKWWARRILRIPLKNLPQQHVQLSFTARPMVSFMAAEQLYTAARAKRYCLSPHQLVKLRHVTTATAWLEVIETAIPTGIDGTPPASVNLTVQTSLDDAKSVITTFFCGPHGKAMATKGNVVREAADVDDSGSLHVLSVAAVSAPPTP